MPAKWLIRKLASYLVETKIPDLNSGFRAFRTDVARQYLNQLPAGFSCVTTITMTFLANGYSVKYMPIEYSPRAGESKFHWWKDTRRYVIAGRAHDPVVQPAADLHAAGARSSAWSASSSSSSTGSIHDFRLATNTLLILFAAFQVIAIGLLADLMVRLSKPRVRGRPRRAVSADHRRSRPGTRTTSTRARTRSSAGSWRRSSPGSTTRCRRSPPARILEVGVGEGEVADRVRAAVPRRVRHRHRPARRVARRALELEAVRRELRRHRVAARSPTTRFDLVLAIEVLEHVPDPARRCASCAGSPARDLVLSVPREPIWRVANMARGKYWGDLGNTPGHIQHWSRAGSCSWSARTSTWSTVHSPTPWTMVAARRAAAERGRRLRPAVSRRGFGLVDESTVGAGRRTGGPRRRRSARRARRRA